MSSNPDYEAVPQYDPDASLMAIIGMLMSINGWLESQEQDIRLAEVQHDDDTYVELCVAHTYARAAASHAAVGALAPFVEGMFRHEFAALRALSSELELRTDGHPRGKFPDGSSHEKFWLPHFYVNKKGVYDQQTDIQRGSLQILKSLHLMDRFPQDFDKITKALFAYRNHSVHNGYEWLLSVRDKFEQRVKDEEWERWISWATSGGKPWIAYLTHEFIDACIKTAVQTVLEFRKIRWEWMKDLPPAIDVPEWIKKIPEPTGLEGMEEWIDSSTQGIYEYWLNRSASRRK